MEITVENFKNIVGMIKSNDGEDTELAVSILSNITLREATKKLLLKAIPLKRSIIKKQLNYDVYDVSQGLLFDDIVECINKDPNKVDKEIFNSILMNWKEKGLLLPNNKNVLYDLN